ncbi:hypothetical protein TRL7639_02380 [Falsiruegeria litorea R37]|uniref:Uncharacterized protein n=1 Tax=Falsiruegeria litorea R37 TaxID=1200284 RepID=A0A1Y5SNA7_9RHOB|nr:hypothetical protein [Falsiruegeria litorea]SLN44630.1 hypothetical protein TRL7639_02380 [Falsiruegeria litorea R37]
MEVRGRDPGTECYRVTHDVDGRTVTALVPERLAADLRLFGSRPSHQMAYVWMAENKDKIEAAIAKLARGKGAPRPPFDQITLIEER